MPINGRLPLRNIRWQEKSVVAPPLNSLYAYAEGRMFERWIDTSGGSARSNGYDENDLITNPSYIFESIIRDECLVERNITVDDANPDPSAIDVSGLKSSVDDYYNNAIYYNHTTGHKTYISDYTGATKTLALASEDTNVGTGDIISLTNIKGDDRIVTSTIDAIGKTPDGTRGAWVMGRSINSLDTAQSLIEQLCFESHTIVVDTYDGYKMIALDEAESSVDTWTVPLTRNSERELVSVRLSPLQDIYTDFRLRYAFDYGSGEYKGEIFVNKDAVSSNALIVNETEKNKCAAAETDYKVKKYFEYSCDWIYQQATAERLLRKLVNWLTKQYAIVTWTGEFSTYIKYEIGDQVLINFPNMIPDAINNSSKFMIFSKEIDPVTPSVTFQLIELGAGIGGYGYRYSKHYGVGF